MLVFTILLNIFLILLISIFFQNNILFSNFIRRILFQFLLHLNLAFILSTSNLFFLFFSKNEGKKINEKTNDILKNQEEIKKDITEIKQILKECYKLEKSNKLDIEKIYKIINQLLLKDLLKEHKNLLNDIKNDNY